MDYNRRDRIQLFIFLETCSYFFAFGGFMSKKESEFQAKLIEEIENKFEGCYVFKNDPTYRQGFPDITILYEDKWAVLECKKSEKDKHQPNQDYYVEQLNNMSYSSFIYPENKEEVLSELQRALKPRRASRISRSK